MHYSNLGSSEFNASGTVVMGATIIQGIIFLFVTLMSYLNDDLYLNSVVTLWGLVIVLIIEFLKRKQINLLFVFILSFLYMIPTEGILNFKTLYQQWGQYNVNTGYALLVTSLFLVFLGYTVQYTMTNVTKLESANLIFTQNKRKKLLILCFLFGLFYLVIHWDLILNNLIYGRGKSGESFNIMLTSISLIVLVINSYILKNKIYAIIISLPILITLVGTGTRLYLVYAIFMIFAKDILNLNLKKAFYLIAICIPIIVGVSIIKESRSGGLIDLKTRSTYIASENENKSINEKIASFGSSEGLIRNTAMITDYTEKKDYTYGKSTGFILYWWIPRSLWPDKPVMLDYWLIREYSSDFSSIHSTASSYIGEIYMDFGYLISLFISFLMGILLATLQKWINVNYSRSFTTLVVGSFLYGWVFFGVRSILTATFMLLYVIVFANIIRILLIKYDFLKSDDSDR